VATLIATRAAVERDILWVTVTCLLIVAASLWVYFRRFRACPGRRLGGDRTVMAFAMAELLFGYVNSSTASWARSSWATYQLRHHPHLALQELRAEELPSQQALEKALAGVMRGTGVAAVCASAAYATLMLTSFRGFYQFGVMAAFVSSFAGCSPSAFCPPCSLSSTAGPTQDGAPDRPPVSFASCGLSWASTPVASLWWPAAHRPVRLRRPALRGCAVRVRLPQAQCELGSSEDDRRSTAAWSPSLVGGLLRPSSWLIHGRN